MKPRNVKFIPIEPVTQGEGIDLKSRSNNWYDKEVEKWNAKDFCMYFYKQYQDKVGASYSPNWKVHMSIFSNLRKRLKDNGRVKLLIDTYFQLGYSVMNVEHFARSNRQNELNLFLEKGILPPFTTYKPLGNVQPTESIMTRGKSNTGSIDEMFGGK